MSATDSLIKRASEQLEDFITAIVPDEVAALIGKRKIVDLNKESAKYRLRLFGIASSNIDSLVLEDIRKVLIAKYEVMVNQIIEDLVMEAQSKGKNPVKAITKGLSNSRFSLEKNVATTIDRATIAENVIFDIPSLVEKSLNEAYQPTTGNAYRVGARAMVDSPFKATYKQAVKNHESLAVANAKRDSYAYSVDLINDFNNNTGSHITPGDFKILQKNNFSNKILKQYNLDNLNSTEKKVLKGIPSEVKKRYEELYSTDANLIKAKAQYDQNKKAEMPVNFSFKTDVNMMRVEADKIIDIIGHTKDRSLLYNYIKLRAGKNEFWRDFVLNLKEIDKKVERDISSSQEDRLLNSMMRKGGVLSPQLFADISEAKYYILALDKTDVDMLLEKYEFDIRKTNALHALFDKYNILAFVISDQIKKEVMIYNSDDPTNYEIISIAHNSDLERMTSMFSSLARN